MTITEQQKTDLVARALLARKNSYAPYSKYHVGAALLTEAGEIFDGVNVENASYPLTMCAERNAVFKAVSAGSRRFSAIAVATENGGSPCGACRQVLSEFGLDTLVLTADGAGRIQLETSVGGLLPSAFGASDLDAD